MICPHCNKEAKIADVVFYNVEAYDNSAIGKTECCGKGIRVEKVITFKISKPYDKPETDDWGNKLKWQ